MVGEGGRGDGRNREAEGGGGENDLTHELGSWIGIGIADAVKADSP
jgi:hypothetical protein